MALVHIYNIRRGVVPMISSYDGGNKAWFEQIFNKKWKYKHHESPDCEHYKLIKRLTKALGWKPDLIYEHFSHDEKTIVVAYVKYNTALYWAMLRQGYMPMKEYMA